MNLIITGSSGFVGTNFIRSSENLNIVEVDLLKTSPDNVDFSQGESVLHLAALVHQMKGAPLDQYQKINRDLAFQVAKRSKMQGVKQFILMSTVKVYGEQTSNAKAWCENSVCNPEDPYGQSKLEAEQMIRELEDDDFKVAIIRSPLIYGQGVKANMLNLIKLVDKIPVLPLGGINNSRSMVYIGNLIALINQILKIRASGIFLAGDPDPISTTVLVRLIAQGLEKKPFIFTMPKFIIKMIKLIKPDFTDRLFGSLLIDNSITNQNLNFVPPYSSQKGILEMVKYYNSLSHIH